MPVQRLIPLFLLFILLVPRTVHAGDSTEVQIARSIGDEGTYVFLGTAVLLPVFIYGENGEGRSLRTMDSIASALAVSEVLKHLIPRDRPDGMGDDSFPSNHAAVAFAAATMAADAHPDDAIWWYGGASLIAWSRYRENRHRPEELLTGAAIGFGVARLEQQLPRGMLISPFFDPEGDSGGVEFIVNF